ncbi:hypothetical protein NDU88_005258 [Pleurodeles waltl]|uniref:SGNH hydrolase-type esterase domain-containing protein n=1 Tax=Pleurodeles waltl TaxID=8319 RepID=A0AAV7VL85_PLEWA|nr:hypothetical protein NDU88_005258 [Pleurodeles waltl]
MVAGRHVTQGTDAEEGLWSKEEKSDARLQEAGDLVYPGAMSPQKILVLGHSYVRRAWEMYQTGDFAEQAIEACFNMRCYGRGHLHMEKLRVISKTVPRGLLPQVLVILHLGSNDIVEYVFRDLLEFLVENLSWLS